MFLQPYIIRNMCIHIHTLTSPSGNPVKCTFVAHAHVQALSNQWPPRIIFHPSLSRNVPGYHFGPNSILCNYFCTKPADTQAHNMDHGMCSSACALTSGDQGDIHANSVHSTIDGARLDTCMTGLDSDRIKPPCSTTRGQARIYTHLLDQVSIE